MSRVAGRIVLIFILVILAAAAFRAESGAHFTATSANVSGAGEAIKINITEWSPDSSRDELVAAWTLTATTTQGGRGGRGGAGGGGGRGGGAGAAAGARGGGGGAAGRGGAGRGGARGGGDATANAPANAAANAAAAPTDVPPDPDLVDPDNPTPRGGRGGGRGGNAAAQTPESSLSTAIKKAPTVGTLWTSEVAGYSIKYAYRLPQPDGGEHIILATDRQVGKWSFLWTPVAPVKPSDSPYSIIELRINAKGEGEARGVMVGKVAVDGTAKAIVLEDYATLPVMLKGLKRQ